MGSKLGERTEEARVPPAAKEAMGSNLGERTKEARDLVSLAAEKVSEAKGHEETPAGVEKQLGCYEEALKKLAGELSKVPKGHEGTAMGNLRGGPVLYDKKDVFSKVLDACFSGWHAFHTGNELGKELEEMAMFGELSGALRRSFEDFKAGETLEQLTEDWEEDIAAREGCTDDDDSSDDVANLKSVVRSLENRIVELEAKCNSLENELAKKDAEGPPK